MPKGKGYSSQKKLNPPASEVIGKHPKGGKQVNLGKMKMKKGASKNKKY